MIYSPKRKISIFSSNWLQISLISGKNENTLNALNIPCLIVWHIQIEEPQAPLKTQFFFIRKGGIHKKTYSFHNHIALWGTACPVHNQLRNQTKIKFSFSWIEFYGLCWSLAPNRLRDRSCATSQKSNYN